MSARIYIGTSGWHYDDWIGRFYPEGITGYKELAYLAGQFDSVENNSSFYRIAGESTYETWTRMTPDGFKFSLKLNRAVTHTARLALTGEAKERIDYILKTTQVLGEKLGAIAIQLPASFRADLPRLDAFLAHFAKIARAKRHPLDIAIEFRHQGWFTEETYALLRRHEVALIAAQSSRYPAVRETTARIAYIRLHGPRELFASRYAPEELAEWAAYIKRIAKQAERIYIYFNNDFHGFAIENGKELQQLLGIPPGAAS